MTSGGMGSKSGVIIEIACRGMGRPRPYIMATQCIVFPQLHTTTPLFTIMSSILPDSANPATLMSRRFRPDQIPDLSGRVALVTGGSAGIGYHDAAALAHKGAKVIIVSANPEHGKNAEAEIKDALEQSGSKGDVVWYGVEMGSVKAVDALAKKLLEQEQRLDILICNGAIGQAPYGLTPDGLERHFEVNRHDGEGRLRH